MAFNSVREQSHAIEQAQAIKTRVAERKNEFGDRTWRELQPFLDQELEGLLCKHSAFNCHQVSKEQWDALVGSLMWSPYDDRGEEVKISKEELSTLCREAFELWFATVVSQQAISPRVSVAPRRDSIVPRRDSVGSVDSVAQLDLSGTEPPLSNLPVAPQDFLFPDNAETIGQVQAYWAIRHLARHTLSTDEQRFTKVLPLLIQGLSKEEFNVELSLEELSHRVLSEEAQAIVLKQAFLSLVVNSCLEDTLGLKTLGVESSDRPAKGVEEYFRPLFKWGTYSRAFEHFQQWFRDYGLKKIEAAYTKDEVEEAIAFALQNREVVEKDKEAKQWLKEARKTLREKGSVSTTQAFFAALVKERVKPVRKGVKAFSRDNAKNRCIPLGQPTLALPKNFDTLARLYAWKYGYQQQEHHEEEVKLLERLVQLAVQDEKVTVSDEDLREDSWEGLVGKWSEFLQTKKAVKECFCPEEAGLLGERSFVNRVRQKADHEDNASSLIHISTMATEEREALRKLASDVSTLEVFLKSEVKRLSSSKEQGVLSKRERYQVVLKQIEEANEQDQSTADFTLTQSWVAGMVFQAAEVAKQHRNKTSGLPRSAAKFKKLQFETQELNALKSTLYQSFRAVEDDFQAQGLRDVLDIYERENTNNLAQGKPCSSTSYERFQRSPLTAREDKDAVLALIQNNQWTEHAQLRSWQQGLLGLAQQLSKPGIGQNVADRCTLEALTEAQSRLVEAIDAVEDNRLKASAQSALICLSMENRSDRIDEPAARLVGVLTENELGRELTTNQLMTLGHCWAQLLQTSRAALDSQGRSWGADDRTHLMMETLRAAFDANSTGRDDMGERVQSAFNQLAALDFHEGSPEFRLVELPGTLKRLLPETERVEQNGSDKSTSFNVDAVDRQSDKSHEGKEEEKQFDAELSPGQSTEGLSRFSPVQSIGNPLRQKILAQLTRLSFPFDDQAVSETSDLVKNILNKKGGVKEGSLKHLRAFKDKIKYLSPADIMEGHSLLLPTALLQYNECNRRLDSLLSSPFEQVFDDQVISFVQHFSSFVAVLEKGWFDSEVTARKMKMLSDVTADFPAVDDRDFEGVRSSLSVEERQRQEVMSWLSDGIELVNNISEVKPLEDNVRELNACNEERVELDPEIKALLDQLSSYDEVDALASQAEETLRLRSAESREESHEEEQKETSNVLSQKEVGLYEQGELNACSPQVIDMLHILHSQSALQKMLSGKLKGFLQVSDQAFAAGCGVLPLCADGLPTLSVFDIQQLHRMVKLAYERGNGCFKELAELQPQAFQRLIQQELKCVPALSKPVNVTGKCEKACQDILPLLHKAGDGLTADRLRQYLKTADRCLEILKSEGFCDAKAQLERRLDQIWPQEFTVAAIKSILNHLEEAYPVLSLLAQIEDAKVGSNNFLMERLKTELVSRLTSNNMVLTENEKERFNAVVSEYGHCSDQELYKALAERRLDFMFPGRNKALTQLQLLDIHPCWPEDSLVKQFAIRRLRHFILQQDRPENVDLDPQIEQAFEDFIQKHQSLLHSDSAEDKVQLTKVAGENVVVYDYCLKLDLDNMKAFIHGQIERLDQKNSSSARQKLEQYQAIEGRLQALLDQGEMLEPSSVARVCASIAAVAHHKRNGPLSGQPQGWKAWKGLKFLSPVLQQIQQSLVQSARSTWEVVLGKQVAEDSASRSGTATVWQNSIGKHYRDLRLSQVKGSAQELKVTP